MKRWWIFFFLFAFLLYACGKPNEDIAFGKQSYANGDKIPLIFSHDGAPDDIATLVYITKHPDIELVGVIQSYGEQHPSISFAKWSVFLYDVIGHETAIMGVGSEVSVDPAQNEFTASWRASADDFWGLDLPEASQVYEPVDGVDLLIELVHDSEQKVTLLVTGAQTDVALALQKDPTIAENIAQIVIMGGAFNVDGNLDQPPSKDRNISAEWNIFADPLGAKQVFTSGIPLSIVPLDGSDAFYMTKEDLRKIWGSDDPVIILLADLWEMILDWWGGGFQIWDIVAAVGLTNPEHFEWTYDGVDVIAEPGPTHGKTFQLNNGSQITRFASDADFDAIRDTVFSILAAE